VLTIAMDPGEGEQLVRIAVWANDFRPGKHSKPIEYNSNNVGSLLALLGVMRDLNVKQFVFSSSATVYGLPKSSPIDESFPLYATNPYGQSKLIAGQVLRDLEVSDPS